MAIMQHLRTICGGLYDIAKANTVGEMRVRAAERESEKDERALREDLGEHYDDFVQYATRDSESAFEAHCAQLRAEQAQGIARVNPHTPKAD